MPPDRAPREPLRHRSISLLAAVAVAVAVLTGCAGRGTVEDDAVHTAAARFLAAAGSDPAEACAHLAPATLEEVEAEGEACAQVVGDVATEPMSLDVVDSQVYGRDALVRLGDEVVFLSRFDDGWRVTAAGCASRGDDQPYDCDIEGR